MDALRPPFDRQVEDEAKPYMLPAEGYTREAIPLLRAAYSPEPLLEALALSERPIEHEEHIIPVSGGEITISSFKSKVEDKDALRPCIYYMHPGGLVLGNRFIGLPLFMEWVEKLGITVFSVEYRLAPEHPYPIPLEDCYSGLKWVESHMAEFKIDPSRLMVAGASAGGGLAAALALKVHRDGGPQICAQLLGCPMLNYKNNTVSAQQFWSSGTWTGKMNEMAWSCYVDPEKADGYILTSPVYATTDDLVGLPTTFIDVSSTEVFRDEDVEYAGCLWKAGVQVELHVWPGALHGFEIVAPGAELSHRIMKARSEWVTKVFSKNA